MPRPVRKVTVTLFGALVTLWAAAVDQRLATIHTVWVEPTDNTGGQKVAECVIEHLNATGLRVADSKKTAELVLRVKAHVTNHAERIFVGSYGGTPSAAMEADLPDGTSVWENHTKCHTCNGTLGAGRHAECVLAEGLLKSLKKAIDDARRAK